MKLRKYHFIRLLYCLFGVMQLSCIFGQQSVVISLKSCQDDAVLTYPTSKDKDLLKQISVLKIKNLETNYFPQVSLDGQVSYQSDVIQLNTPIMKVTQPKDQYKASLDINQLIFDGGTTHYLKQMQITSGDAEVQQVEVDLLKIREQVNAVYFLLISLHENENLLQTTLNDIKDRIKVVDSSVRHGVLISSDLDVLHAEQLKTEQQLSEIVINRKSALTILSILTTKTLSDSSHFELPFIVLNESLQTNRPEYKLFDLQRQRIENNRNMTGSLLMPKIYAFAQGGYGRPGFNMLNDKFSTFYIVGATFKWTLFDWNKNHRDQSVLDFQEQMIQTRRETFDKNLNIDLQNRLASIQKLQEAIQRDIEILVLRRRISQSAASRLDNGLITSTDYLTERNAETIAQINAQTHLIQLEQAKAAYLLAKGQFDY